MKGIYLVRRAVNQKLKSCRGNYRWTVKKRKARLAEPCYNIDPITGKRKLYKGKS